VGVEKGTKAVISANSSVYDGLEFNNLRSNFVAEIPGKEFFNSHRRFHSEPNGKCQTSENEDSCDKRAEDSPTHCSPWHFAKFIHR